MTRAATVATGTAWAAVLWAALLLPLAAGCRMTIPAEMKAGPVPEDSHLELLSYISDMPYVTAEAGYRAVYIFWKRESFEGTFDELTSALMSGKIIGDWGLAPDEVLTRADVGYMVCRACGCCNGLNWKLTGLGRYAWRDLNYMGIANPFSEYGMVPGGQLLGILTMAEDYRYARGPKEDRAQLGDPPN